MRHFLRQAALTAATLVLLLPAGAAEAAPGTAGPADGAGRAGGPAGAAKPDRRASEVTHGLGFEACTAPPLDTMRTWWDDSPYSAVGIYSSGSQRACGQPRLTADWVHQALAMGWRLIPTHVGRQAPCNGDAPQSGRLDPAHATEQGRAEADEAVAGLTALGLGPGNPVYLDIESYPGGNDPTCVRAVVDAVLGWTDELHQAGYLAGFYSSVDSGVHDLIAAVRAGRSPAPDVLWYARWDHAADTAGSGTVPDDLWADQQRIHQYDGDVRETWGGVTLNIDRDRLDAPSAG
ncbi:hypothetical protein GCM10009665_04650 [Kitasatospora nipponensis]|uniref:Rv2525c-like glycoside hydrolase-like domain-containing protein n=1 Tax=Kitasatospora nipponensis TaxID=258049 RepID=A0ABN1VPR8_9ACTN